MENAELVGGECELNFFLKSDTLTVPGTVNLSGILSSVATFSTATGTLTVPGTVNLSGI